MNDENQRNEAKQYAHNNNMVPPTECNHIFYMAFNTWDNKPVNSV